MSDGEKRSLGSYAGWGLGGLILVYFGFPALWFWPIWKVYGGIYPQWMDSIFTPVAWLSRRFSFYQEWVEWGGELLGIK